MNDYQVIIEQVTQKIARVRADNVHDAAVAALAGNGVLIEIKTLPATVRPPKKLGAK